MSLQLLDSIDIFSCFIFIKGEFETTWIFTWFVGSAYEINFFVNCRRFVYHQLLLPPIPTFLPYFPYLRSILTRLLASTLLNLRLPYFIPCFSHNIYFMTFVRPQLWQIFAFPYFYRVEYGLLSLMNCILSKLGYQKYREPKIELEMSSTIFLIWRSFPYKIDLLHHPDLGIPKPCSPNPQQIYSKDLTQRFSSPSTNSQSHTAPPSFPHISLPFPPLFHAHFVHCSPGHPWLLRKMWGFTSPSASRSHPQRICCGGWMWGVILERIEWLLCDWSLDWSYIWFIMVFVYYNMDFEHFIYSFRLTFLFLNFKGIEAFDISLLLFYFMWSSLLLILL